MPESQARIYYFPQSNSYGRSSSAAERQQLKEREERRRRRRRAFLIRRVILLVIVAGLLTMLTYGVIALFTPAAELEPSAPMPTAETFSSLSVSAVSEENTSPAISDPVTPAPEAAQEVEPMTGWAYCSEIPLTENLQRVMFTACETYNVPFSLALALAQCESSFDPEAFNSGSTCWGLMQIHPINYDWLREEGIEPTSYEGNIMAGVLMIGNLLDKYGDTNKALMAYNCGESGADKLWKQGYTSSRYSRHVIEIQSQWEQTLIDLGG